MSSITLLALIFLAIVGVCYAVWRLEARIYLYLFEKLAFSVDSGMTFIDDIASIFPRHKVLLQHIHTIREEYRAFAEKTRQVPKAHEVDAYNGPISNASGPSWRTFYLKAYNGWFEKNCAHFPKTTQLLRAMPEVTCVMFSIMEKQCYN